MYGVCVCLVLLLVLYHVTLSWLWLCKELDTSWFRGLLEEPCWIFLVSPALCLVMCSCGGQVWMLRRGRKNVLSWPYQCELWLSSFPQWSSALSFLKLNETNGSVFEILPSSKELITRTLLPFDMQRFLPMGWFIQAVLNIGRCQGEMGGGDITI